MKLTLGFSTCPNDTFIFDAWVNKKIDIEGLEAETILTDVEDLNKRAFNHEIDITKLSAGAFFQVAGQYSALSSGSAMGRRNGPLVIGKAECLKISKNGIIAIPGIHTTANLLFTMFFPELGLKREMLFSEIEDAVLNEEVVAGVIIHESRFTFENKGLVKIADLGELWEKKTGLPVPLGVIAANNSLPDEIKSKANRILRRSIEFALEHPDSSKDYVRKFANNSDDSIVDKHIRLYVNQFTVDMGREGKEALRKLFEVASEYRIVDKAVDNYFID
jgi:1,4-dihydroxy-6-naphthoate synthase